MKSKSIIVILIVCVVFCLIAICSFAFAIGVLTRQKDGIDFENPPQIGELAPDFELKTTDGESVSLSDFHGKPVTLNFWALWCKPCIEEMPFLQKRYRQHNPELVILAIEEGAATVSLENYVKEAQLPKFRPK